MSTLRVNECFGPTYQGEGPYIGRPCHFIRLHNCPVQCPGCDTHYTWDGSEKAKDEPGTGVAMVTEYIQKQFTRYGLACGWVISGGEPLLYYKNKGWTNLIKHVQPWTQLETSGFIGKTALQGEDKSDLAHHLFAFSHVVVSPKITPCLHGGFTDDELLCNVHTIMKLMAHVPKRLTLKFVCRDRDDIEAILNFQHRFRRHKHEVMVMPYGIEADEVAESCRELLPLVAEYGFTLSPRLHALLWGSQRAV